MPRGPRLDTPGTLHHVIVRGIERSNIVWDDQDRQRFADRMVDRAIDSDTPIYAWALMDNHAHILLRSGPEGLPAFMRRLLTGYAQAFNRRHERLGHLFHNRYKSIVCQEDTYFAELVRYIHLNPLRARVVNDTAELERYPWCGHGALTGRQKAAGQDRDYVLRWFGKRKNEAVRAYRRFVENGIALGQRPELVGGGLIRSLGGWSAVKSLRRSGVMTQGDERVLGDGEFVESLLNSADQVIKRQLSRDEALARTQQRIAQACSAQGIDERLLRSGSRLRRVSAIRSRLTVELTGELGLSLAETARQLGVSTPAIAKIIHRST